VEDFVLVRIEEPNLWNTKALLAQVLTPMMVQEGTRVCFLCDAGTGEAVVQRLRVMISRQRRTLERTNRKPKRFRLHNTTHSETHNGERFDAVVLWKQVSESHVMEETLEDLLAHG
jgi:hypothetical protein